MDIDHPMDSNIPTIGTYAKFTVSDNVKKKQEAGLFLATQGLDSIREYAIDEENEIWIPEDFLINAGYYSKLELFKGKKETFNLEEGVYTEFSSFSEIGGLTPMGGAEVLMALKDYKEKELE